MNPFLKTRAPFCDPEPLPTTEKRRRPRPKAGEDIAFNDGCCNYRFVIAVSSAAVRSGVHARKRLNGANAEIRPDCGSRLVVTTPTAYSSS